MVRQEYLYMPPNRGDQELDIGFQIQGDIITPNMASHALPL